MFGPPLSNATGWMKRSDSRIREAQHEVRSVEEEEHEKENELVFVPFPPMPPAVAGPDRACHERQRTEDHTLVNRDVTLEVRFLVSLPEHAQGLPAAPREAGVCGEGDADVEVEDLLVQSVRVHRCVEEDQRDRGGDQGAGERG